MTFSDIARRKIAMLIPLLGSDKDGEVVAAARKIQSVLANEAKDLHDLVRAVSGEPTVVYRDAFRKPPRRPDPQPNDWLVKAQFCFDHIQYLRGLHELEFVSDMTEKMRLYQPSEKQAAWLNDIFDRIKRQRSA